MTLVEAISEWFKNHPLKSKLHVFPETTTTATSNGRAVRGFFVSSYGARWLGDIFDEYVELRKIRGAPPGDSTYLERLDPADPEFFVKLERHLNEP